MPISVARLAAQDIARANIQESSQWDSAFINMNALATVVACYGLFANSPAVVIGAMIIAMLLGPISGIALGLVDRDNALVVKAVKTLAGGVAVVYATAFLLGLIHSDFPLTSEIYARTSPNLMDLLIAFGGGAAGAYAMISPRLSVAFVGVAIATALVPPLCSSAICLARGEIQLALGAMLLALTNIVAIQVACSVVMWLGGFRGTSTHHTGSEWKRNAISVSVLAVLTLLLGIHLREFIANEVAEAGVRRILETASSDHKGAFLASVRFQRDGGKSVIVAIYRAPVPFTPAETGRLESKLPLMPGSNTQALRIRSIPITVTTKDGYVYDDNARTGAGGPLE